MLTLTFSEFEEIVKMLVKVLQDIEPEIVISFYLRSIKEAFAIYGMRDVEDGLD